MQKWGRNCIFLPHFFIHTLIICWMRDSFVSTLKRLQEIGTNAYQMYGPIARCWVSIVPFIIIYEPKHLKIILGVSSTH
ncbi:hypothetical protein NQ318_003108 [Aromia moschata]|uniref:Uncharacterized protein n=1 Tax=Aromia moschata TaxID=1265417 RepID=A0AAV8YS57_9CUCU|nr:hypothetical protein NQ318_003108 [Aromia moschata]